MAQQNLGISQINSIIANEANELFQLEKDYSGPYQKCVENNWGNICCSITQGATRMYCSQFTFRLALNRPSEYQQKVDFWPSKASYHPAMIEYVRGVLMNFYGRKRTAIFVNFSPSLIVLDKQGETHFIYASRSNFSCLDVGYLIHSNESLNHFCDNILGPYDLENYLIEGLEKLDLCYEGQCLPISVSFHATLCKSRIYGTLKSSETGISTQNCCKSSTRSSNELNFNCLWRALSCVLEVKGGTIERRTQKNKGRGRPNNLIAKRLKCLFLEWYKRQEKKEYGHPVLSQGFDERFLFMLEDFLKHNIVIFSKRILNAKKISFFGIKTSSLRKTRILKVEHCSGRSFPGKDIQLLSDGRNHIRCIYDAQIYSKKLVCRLCNQAYGRMHRFKRHNCEKRNKYKENCLFSWPCSSDLMMEKLLGNGLQVVNRNGPTMEEKAPSGPRQKILKCFEPQKPLGVIETTGATQPPKTRWLTKAEDCRVYSEKGLNWKKEEKEQSNAHEPLKPMESLESLESPRPMCYEAPVLLSGKSRDFHEPLTRPSRDPHETLTRPSRNCEDTVTRLSLNSQYWEFDWDLKHGHIYINVEPGDLYSVSVNVDLIDGEKKLIVTEKFFMVEHISDYLIKFLPKVATSILVERLKKNVKFLSSLEILLNEAKVESERCEFKFDNICLRYQDLCKLKNDIVDYLSFFTVYIQCSLDSNIMDKVMMEILKQLCPFIEKKTDPKFILRYSKQKLSMVGCQGFPIRFINLNSFSAAFENNKVVESSVTDLDKTIELFKNDLGINITGLSSASGIGQRLIGNFLSMRDNSMFYSPPKNLSILFEDCVKYGLLASWPGGQLIHQDGEYKSAISFDVNKFYSRILLGEDADIWHMGFPLEFCKENNGLLKCKPNRMRKTFANLLFLLMDYCLEGEIRSSYHGRELRFGNFPIDGVLFHENKKPVLLSFDGCLWHACKEIHHFSDFNIDLIDPSHRSSCIVCKNSIVKDPCGGHLKPPLFRLKHGETFLSKHKIKKSMTYEQVNYDSSQKKLKISESCGLKHIIIKECEILGLYFGPVKNFFNFYGLNVKKEYENKPFFELFHEISEKKFPMTAYKNLTEKKLIKSISDGYCNGYVVCSAVCGKITQKVLGINKPFFYRDENGVAETSFSVKEKVVSCVLLKELLNQQVLSDFEVFNITKLFEYSKFKNPLRNMKYRVFDSLEKNEQFKSYTGLLKASLNSAIGVLGINVQKYPNSVICSGADIDGLASMKNFVAGQKLNDDYSILHFKNEKQILNLTHIHNSLISYGKVVMIRILIEFDYFYGHLFGLKNFRTNTDGWVACSKLSQSFENLTCLNPNSNVLDIYLRKGMTLSDVKKYLDFKKRHFVNLGICNFHEEKYIDCIYKGIKFDMMDCCLAHKNDCLYPVKIEIVSNLGAIVSTNKLILINNMNGQEMKKCGGLPDSRLNLTNYSLSDLANLFH